MITGLRIQSVDGRIEKIQSGTAPTTWACIFAWMSDSFEEFQKHETQWPSGWSLLAHELETGHSPKGFLHWNLPYETPQQALNLLQSEPDTMAEFVRAINIKQVNIRLENFGLSTDSPLFIAMHVESRRRTRNMVVVLSCFFVAMGFIGVFGPYLSGIITGVGACTIFLIVVLAAIGTMAWAQYQYQK